MKNTNVQVVKNGKENPLGLLKRFQKRVQESGVIPKVRSKRYSTRDLSDLKVKRGKMKKLAGKVVYDDLKRMGKLIPRTTKRK